MFLTLITNATKNSSSTSSGESTSANLRVKYLKSYTWRKKSMNWTIWRNLGISKFYILLQLRASMRKRGIISGLKIKRRKSRLEKNFIMKFKKLTIRRQAKNDRSMKILKSNTSNSMRNSKMGLKSRKPECHKFKKNLPRDLKFDNILISSKY